MDCIRLNRMVFFVLFLAFLVLFVHQRDNPLQDAIVFVGFAYGFSYLARLVSYFERKDMPDQPLPDSTWKKDLEEYWVERMSLEEFINRWSGRELEEDLKEITAESKKSWHGDDESKERMKKLLEGARKKVGI